MGLIWDQRGRCMVLWGRGPSTDPGLNTRRPGGAEPGLGLRMLPGAVWSRWVFLVISVAPIAMVTRHRAGRLWFSSGPAACAAPVAPTHQAQLGTGLLALQGWGSQPTFALLQQCISLGLPEEGQGCVNASGPASGGLGVEISL